jgi:hypothetical protein
MIDWPSLIWTTIRVWKVAIAENGKVERAELLYGMIDWTKKVLLQSLLYDV